MLAITLDTDIERLLESLGAKTRSSKTDLARRALLEGPEDLADVRLAGRRLERKERSWTLEELERGDDLKG